MKVVGVALPRGPESVLTYSVPPDMADRMGVGYRVLIPLGRSNRRCTGYVVDVFSDQSNSGGFKGTLKPVAEVLDVEPVFSEEILALCRFIADYYHAPLGQVIRCALPNGLDVADSRVASLTEQGRSSADDDAVLSELKDGQRQVNTLTASISQVVRRAAQGLITLRYELSRPKVSPRYVSVISLTGVAPEKPLRAGAGPAQLLSLIRQEGPRRVPTLRTTIPNYGAAVRRLVAVGAAEIHREQVFRDPWRDVEPERDTPPTLNAEQRNAVDVICDASDQRQYQGFLLQGVTSSGKTEVYLHALAHVLEQDLGGIVLVPEIALTPQLSGRFRARFGDKVAVLHSGLSDGERLDQWNLIREGERPCVVGARSAVFAPVKNLGIIVVDEEHDSSFKQGESPRYHGRDLALKRGHGSGCPVVLGSATPSLESVANVEKGRLSRVILSKRIGDRPLPAVEMVDLKEHPPVRPEALLSQPLLDALAETVSRKEQAIIFLNRRGFASFLLCRQCGNVPKCGDCSISLTYHRKHRRVSCHYCGFQRGLPTACPECRGDALEMVGTGTEQVESVLAELLPQARVARMDRETTRGRALERILNDFRGQRIDVLVGTQMVTKGHDFPMVTLVGVLLAEQHLKLPDFRASERTFQLLTQVSGRAGRHQRPGRVIVQTFDPNHHSLQCALQHDVQAFWTAENRYRQMRGFPPYSSLALLRVDSADSRKAQQMAKQVARTLKDIISRNKLDAHILGPSVAPLERIKGKSRYQVLLRSQHRSSLHQALYALRSLDPASLGSARLVIDVDPVDLM
jgi:primosomal protein N' (replication factor Y)